MKERVNVLYKKKNRDKVKDISDVTNKKKERSRLKGHEVVDRRKGVSKPQTD